MNILKWFPPPPCYLFYTGVFIQRENNSVPSCFLGRKVIGLESFYLLHSFCFFSNNLWWMHKSVLWELYTHVFNDSYMEDSAFLYIEMFTSLSIYKPLSLSLCVCVWGGEKGCRGRRERGWAEGIWEEGKEGDKDVWSKLKGQQSLFNSGFISWEIFYHPCEWNLWKSIRLESCLYWSERLRCIEIFMAECMCSEKALGEGPGAERGRWVGTFLSKSHPHFH